MCDDCEFVEEENDALRNRLSEERFLLSIRQYTFHDVMYGFAFGILFGVVVKILVDWRS